MTLALIHCNHYYLVRTVLSQTFNYRPMHVFLFPILSHLFEFRHYDCLLFVLLLFVMEGGLLREAGLLASLSVFSLAVAAGYFLNKRQDREPRVGEDPEQLQQQEREISRQLARLSELQAVLKNKADELDLKYLKNAPHILAPECLQEIFDFTPSIIDVREVEIVFNNNRRARRSCFATVKQKLGGGQSSEVEMYYRFVCTFEEQVQYLIEKAQKDFVIFLLIDYSVITDSIDFLLTDPALHAWIKSWSTHVKDQLKDALATTKKAATPETIADVVSFQIQVLMEEEENFLKAVEDLQLESEEQRMSLPTFLEAFLEDLVFEKYGLEIEQLNLEQEQLTPQLLEKLQMLKELKNSLVEAMRKGGSQAHSEGQISDEEAEGE